MKKIYILAITFFAVLCGQVGYGQSFGFGEDGYVLTLTDEAYNQWLNHHCNDLCAQGHTYAFTGSNEHVVTLPYGYDFSGSNNNDDWCSLYGLGCPETFNTSVNNTYNGSIINLDFNSNYYTPASASYTNPKIKISPNYNTEFSVRSLPFSIKIDVQGATRQLVAPVSHHINDMPLSDLTTIIDYYNNNVDTSASINVTSVKKEMDDYIFLTGSRPLSPNLQKFQDWLASVITIQTSTKYDYIKFQGDGKNNNGYTNNEYTIFDSASGEDDDFVKVGQSDPFFVTNKDDGWRLKKYLTPDDSYFIGFVAGLGDGVIETADLAYKLTKFAVNNSPSVLLYKLVTDTKNTVQEQINNAVVVKDLVSVIFNETKRDQIYNAIKDATSNWFDAATFQKTNVQAGYEHGKIVFEILGALVGIEEVKALVNTGKFSLEATQVINRVKGVFNSGRKFKKIEEITYLVDEIGKPISKGDDIARVVNNLADPLIDVQKTLLDRYKTIVENFAETIGDFDITNKMKGNFGEMATDVKISEKGYIPRHTRINDINATGHNGIDNVFEKDGKWFIFESKYSKTGRPSLNPANESTLLPKQMTKEWIEGGTRLQDAIGDPALAQKIKDVGYTSVLATHGLNGSVTYRLVDEVGNIGAVWVP
jgi:hypothetical protein